MIECEGCGRLFPEVVGAPTQVCPHCEREMQTTLQSRAASRGPIPVDPVGAITLAARVARTEYLRFLLLFLPALALEIGIGFVLEAYASAEGLPTEVDAMSDGQRMQFLGVGVPLILLLYSVRMGLWTLVAARVLDVAVGGKRLSRWRELVAPALLMGFVLTLTFAAGVLLLVVGFLVFLHWFMYAPAQLAAGASGVGVAFDRSRRFARDQRTAGFTALVALVGLAVLVPYFMADTLGGTLAIVVPALINWVGGPLVPLLAASYVALALKAPSRELAPASPPVVGRSTTRCPQCATPIAYTPSVSGGATDVVCPSCGRAGKVL